MSEFPPELDYDLSNAVSSLQNCTASINALWGTYAVANFLFAGFGIAIPAFTLFLGVCLTIGYLIFTGGHFILVKRTVTAAHEIAKDIRSSVGGLESPDSLPFSKSVLAVCGTTYPPIYSMAAHLSCDAAILAIIWYRVFAGLAH